MIQSHLSTKCTWRVFSVMFKSITKSCGEEQRLFTKHITTSTDVKIDERSKKDMTSASCDVQGHARTCVQRYFASAHKTVVTTLQSLHTWSRRSSNKTSRLGFCLRIIRNMLKDCRIICHDQSQNETGHATRKPAILMSYIHHTAHKKLLSCWQQSK